MKKMNCEAKNIPFSKKLILKPIRATKIFEMNNYPTEGVKVPYWGISGPSGAFLRWDHTLLAHKDDSECPSGRISVPSERLSFHETYWSTNQSI